MSTPEGTRSLNLGQQLMHENLPLLKAIEAEAENKVLYWAGVLSYLRGMMIASIGPDGAAAVDAAIASQAALFCETLSGETRQ